MGYRYRGGEEGFDPDYTLIFPGNVTCVWHVPNTDAHLVHLLLSHAYAEEIYNNWLDVLKRSTKGERVVPVMGVGEKAFWDPGSEALFVLGKEKMIVLNWTPERERPEDSLTRAKRLVRIALGRIRETAA